MTKLAILHTSPAKLEPLKALAGKLLPGVEVVNFLDDSILPQLARNGGDLAEVQERLVRYAEYAQQVGANVILSACSSVGELVAVEREHVSVPIVRIDEPMAEAAVQRGRSIRVAATLATTLAPTVRLLRAKAAAGGLEVEVKPVLVEGAYERLMAGDKDGHDALLVQALADLVQSVDVVVLAQASMARVLPRLPASVRDKFLTSPRPGMEAARRMLLSQEPAPIASTGGGEA